MQNQLNPLDITEDGEAIGTLHQFSRALGLPRSFILSCLHEEQPDSIILDAGHGLDRFLILDPEALHTLLQRSTQAQAIKKIVTVASDQSSRVRA